MYRSKINKRLSVEDSMQKLSVDDLKNHMRLLRMRYSNLNSYIDSFTDEWTIIKHFMNRQTLTPIILEHLCIMVFAKLEVLKRQALFIHFGVKSMKLHNSDKDALYVPDVSMNKVLNETKYYSSISIEFISSQFRSYLKGTKYAMQELVFDELKNQFQKSFIDVDHLLQDVVGDFKHILALKKVFTNGKIYVIKCPFIITY